MYVPVGRPAFARPYEGVHWRTSLMSSSLLFQQYPACLVCLTLIVFVMGGTVGALWGFASRTCSNLLPAFLCSCWAKAVEYTDCFFAEGYDSPNDFPGYDTKQSDGEVPVMLELQGMQSTPSLPSLPATFWPRAVAPYRVQSMSRIELNTLLMLNRIV